MGRPARIQPHVPKAAKARRKPPQPGSGGVPGIAPRHPPTPPDVRFSRIRRLNPREFFLHQFAAVPLPDTRGDWAIFLVKPPLGRSGVATAVVTLRRFVCSCMVRPEPGLAPSRPSALRSAPLSRGVLTTTASADFRSALADRISLGPIQSLSARAARLYLRCSR